MSDQRFTVRRFSDDFARILRARILDGDLQAGERLNEVRLAETYGISRSPIREALQALSGEGLVTFVPGRGAFVGGLNDADVTELGQVREALEGYAARLAAERVTPEQLRELEECVQVSSDITGDDAERPDFHEVLFAASGNGRLAQFGQSVIAQLRLARSRSATRPGRVDEAVEEHSLIVAAIRRCDPDEASRLARAHVRRATASAVDADLQATQD